MSVADGYLMAAVSRKQLAAASEMLRKGATLLREPCPKCGGVQIKYRDEISCVVCGLMKDRGLSLSKSEGGSSPIKEILEAKALEVAFMLKEERLVERQRDLLDLLSKYIELLHKLRQQVA